MKKFALLMLLIFVGCSSSDQKANKQGQESSFENSAEPDGMAADLNEDMAAGKQEQQGGLDAMPISFDNDDIDDEKSQPSRPRNFDLVVMPQKLTKFPPNCTLPQMLDYAEEMERFDFRFEKDEFEKTKSWENEMRNIWTKGMLFGHPVGSRFLIEGGLEDDTYTQIPYDYDADTEQLELYCQFSYSAEKGIPREKIGNYYARKKVFHLDVGRTLSSLYTKEKKGQQVLPYVEKRRVFNFAPAIAKKVIDEIRVAYVLGFDTKRIAFSTEAYDFLPYTERYVGGQIDCELRPNFLHSIIIYRNDTGEILERTDYQMKTDVYNASPLGTGMGGMLLK